MLVNNNTSLENVQWFFKCLFENDWSVFTRIYYKQVINKNSIELKVYGCYIKYFEKNLKNYKF